MLRASVVIPVYQRADMLAPCLAALEATGLDGIELVLVDNGSTDPAVGPLLDLWEGSAVVRRNPVNAGFAAACNHGARLASAPVVVFLNSDTEVTEGWIEPLLDAVADPGVGIAGSRLLYPDGRVQHAGMALSRAGQPVHLHRGAPGDHPVVTRSRDLLLLTGACCAVSRDLFLDEAGFELSYVNGHEDVDLCLRLAARGLRNVYRADSLVVHHESMSPGRLERDRENSRIFRDRWSTWPADWEDLLAEDGLADVSSADCTWDGPLFDDGAEAAFGRDAVRALVAEGRRPMAIESSPAPLAPGAAALCDDILLAAINRQRIGVPAADLFRHLGDGRSFGAPSGEGPVIAVVGPGVPEEIVLSRADMAMAVGPEALGALQASGMLPAAIAALDPADPRPEEARRSILGARSLREGIAWSGPLLGRSGYAGAGRGLLRAAADIGLPMFAFVGDVPVDGLSAPVLPLPVQDFNPGLAVVHNPPVLPNGYAVWEEARKWLGIPIVGATCFETEGLPASWVEHCNAAREVWVPSSFNLRTFADGGVDPDLLHAVPYPVDTGLLCPIERERDADAPVTFLSIFEWTWRKGWDVLLQAWAEEFAKDEPVKLVVVTYRGAGAAGEGSVLDQAVAHLTGLGFDPGAIADIDLVLEPVPHKGMPDLYRSADAFVLPTRGEGAGMPVLEAASCGVPVIATAWGGYEELMEPATAFPVAVERMIEAPPQLLVDNCLYEGLLLTEPSVGSLRARMRAVVDDPAAAAARGLAGRALVQERFSVAATAAALDARARALLDGPGYRVAR
jgi:GT2 family glycosyltransferase/glycosyltransferase involved in cell wall biosynthesis